MSAPIPFSAQCKTLAINVTASASASVSLPSSGNSIRLVNEGPNNCYVSIGSGSQTATVPPTSSPVATSTPILAGTDITLSMPSDQIYNISAICRTAQTATLLVQVGEGL